MGRERARTGKYIHIFVTGLGLFFLLSCATLTEIGRDPEVRESLLSAELLESQGNYEAALNAYQRVWDLSPHTSPGDEALFKMGLIYAHYRFAQRDYEKSISAFVKVLNDHPKSPFREQARIWIGVLQEHQRLIEASVKSKQDIERLQQAMEKSEKSKSPENREQKVEERGEVREILLRAQKLLAQGDYEGAIAEQQKILSMGLRKPLEDEVLLNLGVIFADGGNPKRDYGRAIDYFKRVIKEHPKSPLVGHAKTWIAVLEENRKLNQVIQKSKQVDIEIEERKREIVK